MVASHTAVPLGTSKWLVRATPLTRNLAVGKGQGLLISPTQGQAYIIGATFTPAIYFPSLARTVTVGSRCLKARLYGWLPLSDASGILIANGLKLSSLLIVLVRCLWHHYSDRFSQDFGICPIFAHLSDAFSSILE